MLNKLFKPTTHPVVEALQISEQYKAFLYDIIKHGTKGASTFDLHAEQHGNISAKVKKLEELGVIIRTEMRDVIDKRGHERRRIAHRIFIGFDAAVIGA